MKLGIKLLPLVLILALTACTSTLVGRPLNEQAIATFKPGMTTIQEVKTQLGSPTAIKQMANGHTILVYTYETSTKSSFMDFLNNQSKLKYQSVTFTFGSNEKLKTISRSRKEVGASIESGG